MKRITGGLLQHDSPKKKTHDRHFIYIHTEFPKTRIHHDRDKRGKKTRLHPPCKTKNRIMHQADVFPTLCNQITTGGKEKSFTALFEEMLSYPGQDSLAAVAAVAVSLAEEGEEAASDMDRPYASTEGAQKPGPQRSGPGLRAAVLVPTVVPPPVASSPAGIET